MVDKLNIKEKINSSYLILVILMLVSSIVPIKLFQLRDGLVEKRTELAISKRDLSLLDNILRDRESEFSRLEAILSTLPQTYLEIGTLTYKIENIASASGLSSEISYDKEAEEVDNQLYVNLTIVTQGSFRNYTNFISSLSKLPYNTGLDGMLIENQDGVLSQTTNLKIYLRK